tara:strand:+ start:484 stop:1203 length:720 start_codon:yes stop_codon:yes gene_type:complete
MSNNNQITAGGMAQLSGLEIFASNTVYGDETVGFGNPLFSSNIDSATDVATEEADAPLNAVETTFTAGFTSNIWYKYHTAGTVYTPIDAPDISGNYARFKGHKDGGTVSFAGIYQKLSGLIVGEEYSISIVVPHGTVAGTIRVKRYYEAGGSVVDSGDSISFTMPYATSILTGSFTASTASDIVLIDFTTETASEVDQFIYSISIKGKEEYLVPIYAEDKWGNAHKILRRNIGNPTLNT